MELKWQVQIVSGLQQIHYPNEPPDSDLLVCIGTDEADNMQGTSSDDAMNGLRGDDTMFGFAGNDFVTGGPGDDTMNGGSGDGQMDGREGNDNINGDSGHDIILGGTGADILKGSSGNDLISHFFSGVTPSRPDGSKDTIDCGSGTDDRAWINVSRDGDTAVNCETVVAG